MKVSFGSSKFVSVTFSLVAIYSNASSLMVTHFMSLSNEIKSFKLNSGYEIPLDDEIINEFKDKWRNEFPLLDERDSNFFNSVAKNKLPEGYENYLSILINNPINFFELVEYDSTYITSDSKCSSKHV